MVKTWWWYLQKGEDMATLHFVINMPAVTAEEFDVVSRRLEIGIAGQIQIVDIPVSETTSGQFNGRHGDQVHAKCWNVNEVGNVSDEYSELIQTLADPYNPPRPGLITLTITGKTNE